MTATVLGTVGLLHLSPGSPSWNRRLEPSSRSRRTRVNAELASEADPGLLGTVLAQTVFEHDLAVDVLERWPGPRARRRRRPDPRPALAAALADRHSTLDEARILERLQRDEARFVMLDAADSVPRRERDPCPSDGGSTAGGSSRRSRPRPEGDRSPARALEDDPSGLHDDVATSIVGRGPSKVASSRPSTDSRRHPHRRGAIERWQDDLRDEHEARSTWSPCSRIDARALEPDRDSDPTSRRSTRPKPNAAFAAADIARRLRQADPHAGSGRESRPVADPAGPRHPRRPHRASSVPRGDRSGWPRRSAQAPPAAAGASGVEAALDDVLGAEHGRLVRGRRRGRHAPRREGRYEAGRNGADVTLTVDLEIQETIASNRRWRHLAVGGWAVSSTPRPGSRWTSSTAEAERRGGWRRATGMPATIRRSDRPSPATGLDRLLRPGLDLQVDLLALATDPAWARRAGRRPRAGSRVRRDPSATSGATASEPPRDRTCPSINTGMATVAQRPIDEQMIEMFDRFGFTHPSGINLGYEGTLAIPVEKWAPNYTKLSASFGQAVSITPLSLARAYRARATTAVYRCSRSPAAACGVRRLEPDGLPRHRPHPRDPPQAVRRFATGTS